MPVAQEFNAFGNVAFLKFLVGFQDHRVVHLVGDLGLPGVIRAVATNPARILGLDDRKGRVAPGYDADLTVFRLPADNGPLEILATVRSGEQEGCP